MESSSDKPALPVNPDYFAAPVCRNCGAELHTPFCAQCGQEKVERFRNLDSGKEAWIRWRLFDKNMAISAWRLATGPGRIAREYVLGARKRHVHPLKLLLVAIALLLLVLGRNHYLASGNGQLGEAMALVQEFAKWSFSLGIFAVLASSLLVFWRRQNYNVIEHLILATYCQLLIILCGMVNLLPTLVWDTPAFIQAHKAASGIYMYVIKAIIVAVAFKQFFVLDWRRDGLRLLLAVAVFVAINWLLFRVYARLVLHFVLQ